MKKRKEIKKYNDDAFIELINGENQGSIFSDATQQKVINIDVAIRLLNKAKSQGNTHIEIEVSGIQGKDDYGDHINCCSNVDITPLKFRYQTPTEQLKEKSKEAVKKAINSERATRAAIERERLKLIEKEEKEKATYLKLKQKFEK